MTDSSSPGDASSNADEAIERIRHIRDAYEEAEAAGTFESMLEFVAEDLVVLAPRMEPIRGRETWAAKFDEWMDDAPEREYVMTYDSVETLVSGDLGGDWGTCADQLRDDDGELLQRNYNYLMVYRRSDDGSCLLSRLMHNTIS